MSKWKLTKRGEFVALIAEALVLFVALWGGAWLMWAFLNTIITKSL
jgi:hypothetical protein